MDHTGAVTYEKVDKKKNDSIDAFSCKNEFGEREASTPTESITENYENKTAETLSDSKDVNDNIMLGEYGVLDERQKRKPQSSKNRDMGEKDAFGDFIIANEVAKTKDEVHNDMLKNSMSVK